MTLLSSWCYLGLLDTFGWFVVNFWRDRGIVPARYYLFGAKHRAFIHGLMTKQRQPYQLATSDDLADEISVLADGVSPPDMRFIIALLTNDTIKAAAEELGLNYKAAERRQKRLRPVLDKIYPILKREAIKGLTVLVPKATQALGKLLDDLKDSKTDTKRKTAEAILDRVIGKPIARVAVREQSDKAVTIEFKNWAPPVIPVSGPDTS